jgi:hypothetical protein
MLSVVRVETELKALEAVRLVADEYGLTPSTLKPCVALLLDGDISVAQRHEAAFVIAIECRRLHLSEAETGQILARWAKKIGYSEREAHRAIGNAYRKTPDGKHWRYHPPGLEKKPGSVYERVLGEICRDVGCPANCAPFQSLRRGPRGEDLDRFERLGWPIVLRRQRHAAAVDYYRAIFLLEHKRGFGAGATLLTSYKQLAELAGRDKRHAGENLRVLLTRGLLSEFVRGSGSGPHARDRQPSRVTRAVPIPNIPPRDRAAIATDGEPQPEMGGLPSGHIGGDTSPHIAGRDRREGGRPCVSPTPMRRPEI